ncbi:tripartite motif-containing protein 66 isoform X1 [Dendrobates tinctorius]|uniref:tripartite motif-containing protein 66 isoform X1 n=1 Tax=Dendrobates tinctorius TaxID=92724 RepID=UPI003CC98F9C
MAKTCYDCTEKNPAHSLCTRCNKWLCSTCAEQHRHGKAAAAAEHYLATSQRGGDGSTNPLLCPVHSQESLKLFCESCDVLMCRHCLVLEHKDHRFRRLDEALQNQRDLLENVITQVEEKKIVVQAAGKQMEERLYEIKHMHRKVENQIKMTKMVLVNELNKRMNALLEQLEKMTSEKQQKFEQQLQSVLLINRQLEHVQNFVNWAMYSKNSVPFLFSKELIVFQMQRLLETSCGSDFGRPLKMKFSWEPSFWTKQISNLGCILTDPVHVSPTDAASYGPIEDVQSSTYYPAHHSAPSPHLAAINSSQSYAPTVQCPTPVCCAHCHTLPSITKSQPTVSHHMNFTHSTTIKQQVVQPIQYSGSKEQKCLSRPLRVIQPWLPHQPPSEHENSPYWSDSQTQRAAIQPPVQNVAPICSETSQDYSQVHTAIPLSTTAPLPAPSVQMQLGPVQSVQQQRQQSQSQTTVCPADTTHEQVMHHSMDIINQQFELEQMQKGLELLLQSQPSSVQLNQSKQPQHVQQTIVGQINYIVRQPAPLPLQSQEDAPPVCDEPISPGGHTVDLSPATAHSPGNPQSQSIADEIIAAVESDACRRNQLSANPSRKRSASESFSNSPVLELSSPRLSRSVDPQMQGVTCQFFSEPQDRCYGSEVETERIAAYGAVEAAVAEEMHLEPNDHLATGGALLGNAICKIENENFSCSGPPPPQPPQPLPLPDTTLGPDSSTALNDIVLPLENMFEEPINLSLKKCYPSGSSSAPRRDPTPPQPVIKEIKNEADTDSRFQQCHPQELKRQEGTSRAEAKETKIPYVRLERLKICPPPSGELPVFKVQPQKKDEDGSLRVLIKYGARYKSMSIKVNADSSHSSSPSTEISPQSAAQSPYDPDAVPQVTAPPVRTPPVRPHPFPRIQSYTGGTQEIRHIVEPEPEHPHECKNTGPSKKSDDPKHIENEDFCAVCLNGGEMLCCDTCPKVYHLSCHVPALLSFPGGEWVCTLCRHPSKPEVEYDCDNTRYSRENKTEEGMLPHLDTADERRCEKMVLSLYCNSLSVPFQEPVSPVARHYYQIIKRPMDLSIILKKLQKRHIPHYSAPEELVSDIRLMFWNCAKFNYEDSEVAEAGRNLELCFEDMLKETYPGRVFPFPQDDDSDTEEIGAENCPLNLKSFHWPNYGAECAQPKRRRRHPMSQKARDFSLC